MSKEHQHGMSPQWAFFGALGITLVVLSGVVIFSSWQNRPTPIDAWWHDIMASHPDGVARSLALLLHNFGGTLSMTLVTAAVVAVLLVARKWQQAITIGLAVAVASGLGTILKVAIARPRPLDGVVDVGLDSFPSGHTTTAAALTVAIALAFPHVWSWVLVAVWVPVMAVSRTYLLVHWATDVLAAAVLGASVALIVTAAVSAMFRTTVEENTLRPPQLAP